MKIEVKHKDCGGTVKLEWGVSRGCGDPACCGGDSVWLEATCNKCKKYATEYACDSGEITLEYDDDYNDTQNDNLNDNNKNE